MPVGCYKQISAIKEGVIMRLQFRCLMSYEQFIANSSAVPKNCDSSYHLQCSIQRF